MRRTASAASILVILCLPAIARGADLTGSLLYDGLPLASTFDDIAHVVATANPAEGGPQVEGSVDLVTSTYHFSGLTEGRHIISMLFLREGSVDYFGDPGNLSGGETVILSDPNGTLELDLDLRYRYRVLSPVDSYDELDGMALDCTDHPVAEYPITFSIEPPPGATTFNFLIYRNECPDGTIDWVEVDSDKPSAEIEWGMAGEDFQQLEVRCTGASGRPLCIPSFTRYQDIRHYHLLLRNQDPNARGTHHSNAVVIPAVASAPGAQGTYWSSAVSMINLTATDRNIVVTFTPRDQNGMTTYLKTTVSLPALSQMVWSDILAEIFGASGAGAIEILGTDLAVTSRTSTPGTDGGSFGQGIPPLQPAQVLSLSSAGSAVMGGVEEGSSFRTNLGLCEVWGESATVEVAVLDALMTEVGKESFELRPYENIQVNRVVKDITGLALLVNGTVKVTVTSGNGRVGAYLSVIDNVTGDPTFIPIAPQSPTNG